MDRLQLTGKKILAWDLTKNKHVLHLFFDDESSALLEAGEWDSMNEVDCWFEHVDGVDLTGATIRSIGEGAWSPIDSDGPRHESAFATINTDKGVCTLDMRSAHNGFYGGGLGVTYIPKVTQTEEEEA